MAYSLTRTIFVLFTTTVFVVSASINATAASPDSSVLDLNSATAQLKLAKPSSSGNGFSSMILATMAVTAVVGALAAAAATLLSYEGEIKMKAFSPAFYAKLRTQVFGGIKQLLFYALSALSLATPKPGQKTVRPRTTFSLDIKLDPVHLSLDDRRRRSLGSVGSSSNLMAATLEPPLIDMLSMTPKKTPTAARTPSHFARTPRSRRSSGSRASPYTLESHNPCSPHYAPGDAALFLPRRMDSETRVQEPVLGKTTHPGRKPGQKPNLQRMRDAKQAAALKREMAATSSIDEWEYDSDWENEPRADTMPRGSEMDGEDVGCLPSKVLELPKPAVSVVSTGVYGRSIFTSDFGIPRVAEV